MNYPFMVRYGKVHFESYQLLMCTDKNITKRLITKYPKFAPFLSIQIPIWTKHNKVYVAVLTYEYIAKMSGIPKNNKDLLLYVQSINHAILSALPNATKSFYKNLVQQTNKNENINISYPITILKNETALDYIADYEAEFEGALEKYGIKVPYYSDVLGYYANGKLSKIYDFFHVYSLEKLKTLYTSSKNYPQSGVTLPLKFYIYKKRGCDTIYISYISPNTIINMFDIKEKKVRNLLYNYSQMLKETTEYLKE